MFKVYQPTAEYLYLDCECEQITWKRDSATLWTYTTFISCDKQIFTSSFF